MVYYTQIQPSEHYLEYHEKDVPWHKVVELILTTKNPRKIKNKFEINTKGYYILFTITKGKLIVINAKNENMPKMQFKP